jgi:hypothetical protein
LRLNYPESSSVRFHNEAISTQKLAGGRREEIVEFSQFVISQSNQLRSMQLCLFFQRVWVIYTREGFLLQPALGTTHSKELC